MATRSHRSGSRFALDTIEINLIIAAVVFVISLGLFFKFMTKTRLTAFMMFWMGIAITSSLLLARLLGYGLDWFGIGSVFSKPLTLGLGPAMIVYGAALFLMTRD